MARRLATSGRAPAGFKLVEEAIIPAVETDLIELAQRFSLAYYALDPDNPRSSASFGYKYDFANDSFTACTPIPDAFRDVCQVAADLAAVAPEDFAECLVNRYEPGATIQPHRDKPVFDRIVGLSLGSAATMVLTGPEELKLAPAHIVLPRRSMYLLSQDSRWLWKHSLPPVTHMRWSMTFRTLSPEGRVLLDRHAVADET